MTGPGLLIDSFAWLEILKGSDRGLSALYQVMKSERCCTSVLSLYKIRYRVEQIRDAKTTDKYLSTIETNTELLHVNDRIARVAGELQLPGRMLSTVDRLLLATARIHNLQLLTGDSHFRGLEDAIMV
jgi:predicted nucleic acid-binding protein